METLEISKTNAIKAYNGANTSGKQLLTDLFGQKVFDQKITDRVKSFEDACAVLGVNARCDRFTAGTDDENAYNKLKVVAEVLNEGWKPDWNNGSEEKWYPWFYLNGAFRLDCVSYGYSFSTVASRLCFKSRELAVYASKQFLPLYKDFLS